MLTMEKEKEEELDYAGITITPKNVQQKQKVMVKIPLKNPDNVLGGGIWLATKGNLATKYTVLKKIRTHWKAFLNLTVMRRTRNGRSVLCFITSR